MCVCSGAPSQPAHQSSLRSPREEVWGSKGVFDDPFVANPFQAGVPAAPSVQRPLSSGPLGKHNTSVPMLEYVTVPILPHQCGHVMMPSWHLLLR